MENTAKNFALQLGSLFALYVSLASLLTLLFGIINATFPDVLTDYWQYESAQNSMRFSIAIVIVFFPAYLILTRLVNKVRRKEEGVYLALTRWLIYLSLLVGGAVLLGDLVAVINTFLNGEITERFIFKALSVFIVVGAAFHYYLLDAKGYWNANEQKSILYALATSVVVFASLLFGFTSIDAPTDVREQKLDQQQVSDLQDMQWRIEDYYRSTNKLPESLEVLYVGRGVPQAPEGRTAYSYSATGEREYELCAHFAYNVQNSLQTQRIDFYDSKNVLNNNWDYTAGETCFRRVITAVTSN